MKWLPDGDVTTPAGFQAGSAASGLKAGDQLDITLIVADRDCAAAGTFTRNLVVAAPVVVSRETLSADASRIRGVVANAGNANACTGRPGLADARAMQAAAAEHIGCAPAQILVLSTGVIGLPMPMDIVTRGIAAAAAALAPDGGAAAARSIMTTDTRPKHAALAVDLPGGRVTLGGITKGAGMIHPKMATMLAVLTTDAALPAPLAADLLRAAVEPSFNRISVDGDTSTNDTVLLLANGASGVTVDAGGRAAFAAALDALCTHLAQAIVRDGEGASKFVTLIVSGAADDAGAHRVAETIATSPLVKTAVAGGDANWGRILAAAGRAGVPFDPAATALWVGRPGEPPLQLLADGEPLHYDEAAATAVFAGPAIDIRLDLGQGEGETTMWTCDFTHDYVAINADYRS